MSSLVGPLVTPNRYENRFDRSALYIHTYKHPLAIAVAATLLAAAGTGAGIAMHVIPNFLNFCRA
jgi:hypothetical protein